MQRSRHRFARGVALAACLTLPSVMLWVSPAAAAAGAPSATTIQTIVRRSMMENHLKSAIVQVRVKGADVYSGALGESMTAFRQRRTCTFATARWRSLHVDAAARIRRP